MSKRGKLCTALGLLLLLAALGLTAYNLWLDARASMSVDVVLERLTPTLSSRQSELPALSSGEALEEAFVPDYVLNPEMAMPEETIDGRNYIGVLDIPALGLSFPIISEWSYDALQIVPCRYSGSAYLDNLVIAGHNYRSHFASLSQLQPGDTVTFTDMDGNVFSYEVSSLETLSPYAVSDMTSGDWDLTLFTCTVGGQSRLAIRCDQAE
jgi:sortase A